MALDRSLPLKQRQRLAAKRTHEVRQKETENKIRVACHALIRRGEPLRLTLVAKEARVARQTVANYRHILVDVTNPSSKPPAASEARELCKQQSISEDRPITTLAAWKCCYLWGEWDDYKNVKHAVRQISSLSLMPLALGLKGSREDDSS